jgi:formylglycine-generating enzyme
VWSTELGFLTWVVALGVALSLFAPCCSADSGAAGRSPWSGPVDPTMENPDCPLMPAVPGGLPVPVPPTGGGDSGPECRLPSIMGTAVRGVAGAYSGMIMIPAGPFDMGCSEDEGSPDERPLHRVNLRKFHIAEHEVTVREFCEFLNKTGLNSLQGTLRVALDAADCPIVRRGKTFYPKEGRADEPMVCVSWPGAAEFAKWVGGRLPTVAEWEKAAAILGLDKTQAADGIQPTEAHSSDRATGGLGGHVWEWCADWYASDYYSNSPADNPTGPSAGQERELRGWSAIQAEGVRRIRNRHKAFPDGCYRTVGFRIVKD